MKKKIAIAYNNGLEDALIIAVVDGHMSAQGACDYYLDLHLGDDMELPKSLCMHLRAAAA